MKILYRLDHTGSIILLETLLYILSGYITE